MTFPPSGKTVTYNALPFQCHNAFLYVRHSAARWGDARGALTPERDVSFFNASIQHGILARLHSAWHTEKWRQLRVTLFELAMPGCATFIMNGLRRRVNCVAMVVHAV